MGWGGDYQPGDVVGSDIRAGWQRRDGSWTYDQNDPDFDDRPEFQEAKGQRGGAEQEPQGWRHPGNAGSSWRRNR